MMSIAISTFKASYTRRRMFFSSYAKDAPGDPALESSLGHPPLGVVKTSLSIDPLSRLDQWSLSACIEELVSA